MSLNEYTKEDLIKAIEKIDFKKSILRELPIIRYNRMCEEAQKISVQASDFLKENKFALSKKYFDKSNNLYEKANKLLDRS